MKLKEVLTKMLKGDPLTEEERTFVAEYDEQKILDGAASAARKKAEGERDGFRAKVDELTKALEDAQKTGANSEGTIAKLQKDVADLIKANKESAEKIAAQARSEAIRKAVGDAKIVCAKGISNTLFDRAVTAAFEGVDMGDAEVVKATLSKFQSENPAMIGVDGVGGVNQKGLPGVPGGYNGPNPFSKKSFNLTQSMELLKTNPEQAKALQDAASKEESN